MGFLLELQQSILDRICFSFNEAFLMKQKENFFSHLSRAAGLCSWPRKTETNEKLHVRTTLCLCVMSSLSPAHPLLLINAFFSHRPLVIIHKSNACYQ